MPSIRERHKGTVSPRDDGEESGPDLCGDASLLAI